MFWKELACMTLLYPLLTVEASGCSCVKTEDWMLNLDNADITASSYFSIVTTPPKAKMSYNGWAPKTASSSEYLEISLGAIREIKGLETLGRSYQNQRVKSYQLHYSLDGTSWQAYLDKDGNVHTFIGNDLDYHTKVTNYLNTSYLEAAYIRVYPQTWHSYPVMKLAVLVCSERTELSVWTGSAERLKDALPFSYSTSSIPGEDTYVYDLCDKNYTTCIKVPQNEFPWQLTLMIDNMFLEADGEVVSFHITGIGLTCAEGSMSAGIKELEKALPCVENFHLCELESYSSSENNTTCLVTCFKETGHYNLFVNVMSTVNGRDMQVCEVN